MTGSEVDRNFSNILNERKQQDNQFGVKQNGANFNPMMSPNMQGKGGWVLIPAEWHAPLEQGFAITRRAAGNPLAKDFASYMASEPARVVMRRYGFVLPGE